MAVAVASSPQAILGASRTESSGSGSQRLGMSGPHGKRIQAARRHLNGLAQDAPATAGVLG
jgi:hypothetical protein